MATFAAFSRRRENLLLGQFAVVLNREIQAPSSTPLRKPA
jgi:hypothetical protein